VARESYGRLLAYLAARWRDMAAAEDALGAAFVAARETWPRDGVPDRPEARLLAAARRRLVDAARHARVTARAAGTVRAVLARAEEDAAARAGFPDERLALLFVCAHPEDPAARDFLVARSAAWASRAR
jgi:RNA polymerase sigma-70 factor (ECF subfamily)